MKKRIRSAIPIYLCALAWAICACFLPMYKISSILICAGVSIGLTYGKTLGESVEIGTMLAASVITSSENVCPRFQPAELGLDIQVED